MVSQSITGIIVAGALVTGIIITLAIAVSFQTSVVATTVINRETPGPAFTTATLAMHSTTFAILACNNDPTLLNILPIVMAQTQVVKAEGNYSDWVEQNVSNETGTYSDAIYGAHAIDDMEINIASLKPTATSECLPGYGNVNSYLSLLVPIVDGQFNASGTQVVQQDYGPPNLPSPTASVSDSETFGASPNSTSTGR